MIADVVTISPEIQSGAPVFAKTRVPVKILFDYLKAGDSIEEFLHDYPSIQNNKSCACCFGWKISLPSKHMRKILLDENLPRPLAKHFSGVQVISVHDIGWAEKRTANSSARCSKRALNTF